MSETSTMRVIIAGAGDLGLQLLRDLTRTKGNEVVVVEIDEEVAANVADDFDALVIHGDAAHPEILDEAQIDQADGLVAVTGSDAINTVIAMVGHRKEVERIVVKLTSPSLRGALDEIGVTDIVAPTMAAAAHIKAALHGAGRSSLAELAQGSLEMAEIPVGPGAAGTTVGDVQVPDGALLVAVVHGDDASLPHPDTRLEEGDVVVVVSESEDALEDCRARLERRGR